MKKIVKKILINFQNKFMRWNTSFIYTLIKEKILSIDKSCNAYLLEIVFYDVKL